MNVTPETIEKQLFTQRFRGYDQQEVDRFLDRVSARLSELTAERDELVRERDELAARVRELEESGGESEESEKLLQRTLVVAQRTADETVHDARATAEQTIADARAEAEEITADARRQAAAEQERAKQIAARIRDAVEDFARFRGDLRERFEAAVAEQLAVLDRTELPDLPEGLRNLDDLAGEGSASGGHSVGGEPARDEGAATDSPSPPQAPEWGASQQQGGPPPGPSPHGSAERPDQHNGWGAPSPQPGER